jgi:hypothetical protein
MISDRATAATTKSAAAAAATHLRAMQGSIRFSSSSATTESGTVTTVAGAGRCGLSASIRTLLKALIVVASFGEVKTRT